MLNNYNPYRFNNNFFGVIKRIADGVAEINGILSVCLGELIIDENFNYGLVLNLKMSLVDGIFLSENNLKAQNLVYKLGFFSQINCSPYLFGKVVDPFGTILLSNNNFFDFFFKTKYWTPILKLELRAPSILMRQSVYESLLTGIKIIDALIPIGLGQRELIIGDRLTGKTTILLDLIINQSNNNFEFCKTI